MDVLATCSRPDVPGLADTRSDCPASQIWMRLDGINLVQQRPVETQGSFHMAYAMQHYAACK